MLIHSRNHKCSNLHITYHFILTADEGTIVLPYIKLGLIEAVETYSLPTSDDDLSDPINVAFPFGRSSVPSVYVSIDYLFFMGLCCLVYTLFFTVISHIPYFLHILISLTFHCMNALPIPCTHGSIKRPPKQYKSIVRCQIMKDVHRYGSAIVF